MRTAILVILAVLIVGAGAYFAGKNGLSVSFNNQSASSTLSPSIVPTRTLEPGLEPEPVPPTPTAKPDESAAILAGVKAGLIAEHGQGASDMTLTISKIEGDFAKGMANDQGGGGIWFAAKVNGEWKLVWDGNGVIMCSDLTNYSKFPTDLIPECWDSSTDKLITR